MRRIIQAVILFLILLAFLTGCDNFGLIDQFSISSNSPATGPGSLAVSPTSRAIRVGETINFLATGGIAPYVFSLQAGGAGGTIDPISGVYTAPTTVGSATAIVTDSEGTAVQADIVIVAASQLQITPTNVTIGVNSTYQFSALGGAGGYTFTLVWGGGTISSGGLYQAPATATSASIRVTDAVGSTSDTVVTVVSGGALSITPANPQVPENGSITFAGAGGTPGYTFSLTGIGTINSTNGSYLAVGGVGVGAATITITDAAAATRSTSVDIIPAAPGNLAVISSSGGMSLTWENNASTSDSVVIERKHNSTGPWTTLVTLGSSATSYFDPVSPNKDLYVYRVYATSGTLDSPYSNEAFEIASP